MSDREFADVPLGEAIGQACEIFCVKMNEGQPLTVSYIIPVDGLEFLVTIEPIAHLQYVLDGRRRFQ